MGTNVNAVPSGDPDAVTPLDNSAGLRQHGASSGGSVVREDMNTTYEEEAREYDALMSSLEFRVLAAVAREFAESREQGPAKVIDFCCGTGLVAGMLGDMPDLTYTGIDLHTPFLAAARERMRHRKNFSFLEADVRTYRGDAPFDAALMTFGYHHLEDPFKLPFLKHVHGLLREDGLFIVGDYVIPPYEGEEEFKKANTDFYARRLSYLRAHDLVSDDYVEAFGEFCSSSADHVEFKVDYRRIADAFEKCGFLKVKEIKTWPDVDLYGHERVGDFVFVFRKG